MPAYGAPLGRLNQSHFFQYIIFWLVMILIVVYPAPAGSLVNSSAAIEKSEFTSIAGANHSNADRAAFAVVPELMPRARLGDGSGKWTRGRILKEVGKQAIEQPGHFLIGGAPIWASRYLVGVPWFGWVAAPIIAYREWLQWPSNRWWDPPLDWAFFTLGAVAATWGRRPGHGLARGFTAIRQSLRWGPAFRGRMRPAG